jgi:hypothetical protein
MTGDARDSEAVWRDLVAHYSAPDAPGDSPTPWPDRENLPASASAKDCAKDTAPDRQRADDDTEPGIPASDPPAPPAPADPPASADPPAPADPPASADPVPGVVPGPPQVRIIRPATPLPPPPPDSGEHFVPPPPPPLPKLDPVSKGAWVALFGGPAYLLVAVIVHWQIPSVAAFIAVAAFVGGFATLVMRMDDKPPEDSGPDDGAVV